MSIETLIEPYIVLNGVDKGRIKDIGLAYEVAETDYVGRDEHDKPMLGPPERVGKSEIYYSDLIEIEVERLVIDSIWQAHDSDVLAEIHKLLTQIHTDTHDRSRDPEANDASWYSWRIANKLFQEYEEAGFDLDTCNEIAAMPFAEAFETAYSYLTQAGLDADEVLSDYLDKSV